jgi:hypothetical protein
MARSPAKTGLFHCCVTRASIRQVAAIRGERSVAVRFDAMGIAALDPSCFLRG